MMRGVMLVAFAVMTSWLILSAAARLVLQLSAGQSLDPLPFTGGALGVVGLVLLIPGFRNWRRRHARK